MNFRSMNFINKFDLPLFVRLECEFDSPFFVIISIRRWNSMRACHGRECFAISEIIWISDWVAARQRRHHEISRRDLRRASLWIIQSHRSCTRTEINVFSCIRNHVKTALFTVAKANERNQTIDGSNRSPNWINVYQENHKKKLGSSSINHWCCLDPANGFVYFFVGFITNTGQASIIYRNLSIVYAAQSPKSGKKNSFRTLSRRVMLELWSALLKIW